MPRRESVLWLALIAAVAFVLCRPFWSGVAGLGFRDTAHFYFPLYEWIAAEQHAGRSTAWNPYDGGGVPLLADAGTCAAYPLHLIWRLSGCPFSVRCGLYLTLHLLLAMIGMFWAARRQQLSPTAAALAALSYGLGGVTLSQSCNLVYLVGSTWLPWLCGALCGWLQPCSPGSRSEPESRWRTQNLHGHLVAVAAPLALLVLGGDIEAAYLGVLVAVGAGGLLWFAALRGAGGWSIPAATRRTGQILAAIALAGGLSAVAWLPQSAWNQNSVRTYTTTPRSIWEWLGGRSQTDPGPTGPTIPAPDGSDDWQSTYEFSQPPWTVLECFVPHVWGQMYPQHRRWDAGFPAADRIWYPSLYPGAIPLLLLIAGCGVAVAERRRRHSLSGPASPAPNPLPRQLLVGLLLVGVLGSFGWYGPGWVCREIAAAVGKPLPPWLAPQTGGVYWLLQWLLPGFCQFRYPAKLLVLASLAVPLLAATACERWRRALAAAPGGPPGASRAADLPVDRGASASAAAAERSLPELDRSAAELWRRWLTRIGLAQAGLGLAALLFLGLSGPALRTWPIPADPTFGPFDSAGALGALRASLLHAALCGAVVVGLAWLTLRGPGGRQLAIGGLLVATLVDVSRSNAWLLPAVPIGTWYAPLAAAPDQPTAANPAGPSDDLLARSVDPAWLQTSSPDRLAEVIRFYRATDFPKFHLLAGKRILPPFNSLESLPLRWLLGWAAAQPETAAPLWPLFGLGRWTGPQLRCVALADDREPLAAASRRQVRLRPSDRAAFNALVAADVAALTTAGDSRGTAEISEPTLAAAATTLRIRFSQPGRVVIGTAWSPGWQATLRDLASGQEQSVAVERFAGVLQSVTIARSGDYELRSRFTTPGAAAGTAVSGAAVLVLLGCCVWRLGRRPLRGDHS